MARNEGAEPVLHLVAPCNTLRLLTVTYDDLREHQEEC
jgi:hypothetical protein